MREKVISVSEMAQVEKGFSAEALMELAGKGVAQAVASRVSSDQAVTLLIGKGNNGADAYVAGCYLKEEGFSVVAHHLYPLDQCSPLCQQQHDRFRACGGRVVYLPAPLPYEKGVLLDGLVGIGFHGEVEGLLAEVICAANASGLPIYAVDLPSGLNAQTAEVGTHAIRATVTCYLQWTKVGFFLGSGWEYVGELCKIEIGLGGVAIRGEAELFSREEAQAELPFLHRVRHKYESGYVVGFAGSFTMPGAAALSALSCLRAGAGIIRLFYPQNMVVNLAPEIIHEAWELSDCTHVEQALSSARAAFLGPGMGREEDAEQRVAYLLAHLRIPYVIDGDALHFLAQNPRWNLSPDCILTPHAGELRRLLNLKTAVEASKEVQDFDSQPLPLSGDIPQVVKAPESGSGWSSKDCAYLPRSTAVFRFKETQIQEFVDEKGVVLVCKGAPTWVFHPHGLPFIIPHGDPGMATAGSGDVLTGIIAALLAQQKKPLEASLLGVYLHARAGELAAQELTSRSVVASDLIRHLPSVYAQLTAKSRVLG